MLDILLLLGVIGAALAFGGAALLRFVRNFNHREVSPAPMSPIGASAAIPHDLVFLHGGTRIELDSQANTITFVRCHLGNGFWTLRSSPTFTCPLSEVVDVYHQPHRESGRGTSYETRIVTNHGKASIFLPAHAPQDAQLKLIRQALAPICTATPSAGFTQSPMFVLVLGFIGGAIALLGILVFLYFGTG